MLIFVRHGRTAANRAGLLQGRIDQELDEVGREQAIEVAKMVREMGPVDAVIASPLKRAQQTASAFGMAIESDDRFLELAYGELEGVKLADVPAALWKAWRDDLHYKPAGGESLAALDSRVRGACDELVERGQEENIVVVSHVSPMKSAVAWALGVDIGISWNCHLDQAAVCRITIRNGVPILKSFNETVAKRSSR